MQQSEENAQPEMIDEDALDRDYRGGQLSSVQIVGVSLAVLLCAYLVYTRELSISAAKSAQYAQTYFDSAFGNTVAVFAVGVSLFVAIFTYNILRGTNAALRLSAKAARAAANQAETAERESRLSHLPNLEIALVSSKADICWKPTISIRNTGLGPAIALHIKAIPMAWHDVEFSVAGVDVWRPVVVTTEVPRRAGDATQPRENYFVPFIAAGHTVTMPMSLWQVTDNDQDHNDRIHFGYESPFEREMEAARAGDFYRTGARLDISYSSLHEGTRQNNRCEATYNMLFTSDQSVDDNLYQRSFSIPPLGLDEKPRHRKLDPSAMQYLNEKAGRQIVHAGYQHYELGSLEMYAEAVDVVRYELAWRAEMSPDCRAILLSDDLTTDAVLLRSWVNAFIVSALSKANALEVVRHAAGVARGIESHPFVAD